jgi:phospholipid transport system transporter-binding protein
VSDNDTPGLESAGNGRFVLHGELSFNTVPGLLASTRNLVGEIREVTIDLGGVEHSDSAGVALLIEWLREVRCAGYTVTFVNIPSQMLAIARASSIDSILPLARE